MSGNYQDWSAPSRDETAQAVAAGLATARQAYLVTAAETHELWVSHGPAVVSHQVGEPGRSGDPDTQRDAADG
jgi:hypothetical protein